MARKRSSTEKRGEPRRRPAVRRRDSLPDGDAGGGSTTEENRGRPFFEKLRMLQLLHDDGGKTIFTKSTLAEEFFDSELADAIRKASVAPAAGHSGDTVEKVRARYRKSAARMIEALQKFGVPILDVDAHGEEVDLEEEGGRRRSRERRWKYDAADRRAADFARLVRGGKHGTYELVGILACEELVKGLSPTPATEGVRTMASSLRRGIPRGLYAEALEQAREWRYSLTNPAKYAAKRDILVAWNKATIEGHQVRIRYRKPGADATERTLAPLGTRFDREEDAVYFLGAEPDSSTTGVWKRPVAWKLDRVESITSLPERPTPPSSAYPGHRLLGEVCDAERPLSRVDVERLYADSVGAFFSYEKPPVRLVMLIHVPVWMAWCVEKPFHPRQVTAMETGADGRPCMRLVVDRCHEDEMVPRLLRLGEAITVLEPATLVERMVAAAEGIARRHRGLRG